jgi:nitrate reductase delta subunit
VDQNDTALPGWFTASGAVGSVKLGNLKKSPEQLQHAERIKQWTRERFTLAEEDAILVSEIGCALPGCPPLETVVAFWTEDKRLHHFKVFKPLAEVVEEDLPWSWLKDALAEQDGYECC